MPSPLTTKEARPGSMLRPRDTLGFGGRWFWIFHQNDVLTADICPTNSLECDSGLRQHQEKMADGYREHQLSVQKERAARWAEGAGCSGTRRPSSAWHGGQDVEEGHGTGTAVILQA